MDQPCKQRYNKNLYPNLTDKILLITIKKALYSSAHD